MEDQQEFAETEDDVDLEILCEEFENIEQNFEELDSDQFISGIMYMRENIGGDLISKLNDSTAIHRIQNPNYYLESDAKIFFDRYYASKFKGILIDSGGEAFTTAGYQKYPAFQRILGKTSLLVQNKENINVRFGRGVTELLGHISIETQIRIIKFFMLILIRPFYRP